VNASKVQRRDVVEDEREVGGEIPSSEGDRDALDGRFAGEETRERPIEVLSVVMDAEVSIEELDGPQFRARLDDAHDHEIAEDRREDAREPQATEDRGENLVGERVPESNVAARPEMEDVVIPCALGGEEWRLVGMRIHPLLRIPPEHGERLCRPCAPDMLHHDDPALRIPHHLHRRGTRSGLRGPNVQHGGVGGMGGLIS